MASLSVAEARLILLGHVAACELCGGAGRLWRPSTSKRVSRSGKTTFTRRWYRWKPCPRCVWQMRGARALGADSHPVADALDRKAAA